MLKFDGQQWCIGYATLAQTKSLCSGFIQNNLESDHDVAKLQQIQAIEKANRIKF